MTSPALILSHATAACRNNLEPVSLCDALTAAQSGCAYRLMQANGLAVAGNAAVSVQEAEATIKKIFPRDSVAANLLGNRITSESFEKTVAPWLDQQSALGDVAAGYWLADVFLRGVDYSEASELTRLLAGKVWNQATQTQSARRYPTGGISEKQALLLPPLMHALSPKFGWCSPFLVAARLAHTGGTRDKLSVLPGFRLAHVQEMASWSKRKSFRYFAVGADLCPRDAAMYRIRSETGTVADLGLMASSIMSKQIALPADVIVLDVLYGPTAFIKCESKAEEFGQLCASIGSNHRTIVIPKLREASELLGRSVGASTELLEAAEILSGKELHESARAELSTATSFLRLFAQNMGLNSEKVTIQVERALRSGDAFNSMLTLWQEHGVKQSFLNSFARNPRAALLGELPSINLRAPASGRLQWDAVAVADIANHVINQNNRSDEQHNGVNAGGLELTAMSGDWVSQGDILATIYASNAEDAASRLRKTVSIRDNL